MKDGFLVLGVSVRDAKRAEYFYRRFLSYMEERHGLCTRPGGKTREMADAPYSARLSHLLWTGTRFVRGQKRRGF